MLTDEKTNKKVCVARQNHIILLSSSCCVFSPSFECHVCLKNYFTWKVKLIDLLFYL